MKVSKVYFATADWCSSCKALKPNFIKWADENKIEYKFIDVESDEGAELVEGNKIRNLPTLLFLDQDDNVIGRESGNIPVKEFDKYL